MGAHARDGAPSSMCSLSLIENPVSAYGFWDIFLILVLEKRRGKGADKEI